MKFSAPCSRPLTRTDSAFLPLVAQINSGAIHAVFLPGKAQPRLLDLQRRLDAERQPDGLTAKSWTVLRFLEVEENG